MVKTCVLHVRNFFISLPGKKSLCSDASGGGGAFGLTVNVPNGWGRGWLARAAGRDFGREKCEKKSKKS